MITCPACKHQFPLGWTKKDLKVFRCVYIRGLTAKETAETEDLTPHQVEASMKKLRKTLEGTRHKKVGTIANPMRYTPLMDPFVKEKY